MGGGLNALVLCGASHQLYNLFGKISKKSNNIPKCIKIILNAQSEDVNWISVFYWRQCSVYKENIHDIIDEILLKINIYVKFTCNREYEHQPWWSGDKAIFCCSNCNIEINPEKIIKKSKNFKCDICHLDTIQSNLKNFKLDKCTIKI